MGRAWVRDNAGRSVLLILTSVALNIIKPKKNEEEAKYLNLTPN